MSTGNELVGDAHPTALVMECVRTDISRRMELMGISFSRTHSRQTVALPEAQKSAG